MLAAVIVPLAISTPAGRDSSQIVMPSPGKSAGRERAQEVTASGIIRGRITSLDTGKPAQPGADSSRIRVRLPEYAADREHVEQRTLRVSRRCPGRYTLRVERSGYLALTYGQRRPRRTGPAAATHRGREQAH
jgi:hypothetical protein